MSTRIVIADPLELIAEGVRSWLRDEEGYTVVDHVATGDALLEFLKRSDVDLVLLEVSLPGMDGIDTMRAIRKAYPELKVLAFSSLNDIEYVNSMLIEGARGYLVRGGGKAELLLALFEVISGHRYLSASAKTSVDAGYHYTDKRPEGAYVGLTQRERDIIRMIAKEHTNAEIGAALFITEETVKSHRKSLMTKLNVRSMAGLVKYALDRRWA
ncbi:MAG TPA: response regulator transcription factor [Flavobacteriales bacterium]|nr:response regulator transcription factor [Flavobacteriales bacterium]